MSLCKGNLSCCKKHEYCHCRKYIWDKRTVAYSRLSLSQCISDMNIQMSLLSNLQKSTRVRTRVGSTIE